MTRCNISNRYPSIRQYFVPHTNEEVSSISHLSRTSEEWLSLFYDICSKHDITLYLLYGTCLGIVRDKQLIEHDTDADLGIMLTDLNRLYQCVPELLANGFYISGRGTYQVCFSLPNISFYIDIWPIKKISNPLLKIWGFRWFCDHVYFKDNYFDSSESVMFQERAYYVPTPAAKYLERIYGKTWQTPIKHLYSGPRGKISQWVNALFVDFDVPIEFSGDNTTGTFKPWVSKILKNVCPHAKLSSLFKHPEIL